MDGWGEACISNRREKGWLSTLTRPCLLLSDPSTGIWRWDNEISQSFQAMSFLLTFLWHFSVVMLWRYKRWAIAMHLGTTGPQNALAIPATFTLPGKCGKCSFPGPTSVLLILKLWKWDWPSCSHRHSRWLSCTLRFEKFWLQRSRSLHFHWCWALDQCDPVLLHVRSMKFA